MWWQGKKKVAAIFDGVVSEGHGDNSELSPSGRLSISKNHENLTSLRTASKGSSLSAHGDQQPSTDAATEQDQRRDNRSFSRKFTLKKLQENLLDFTKGTSHCSDDDESPGMAAAAEQDQRHGNRSMSRKFTLKKLQENLLDFTKGVSHCSDDDSPGRRPSTQTVVEQVAEPGQRSGLKRFTFKGIQDNLISLRKAIPTKTRNSPTPCDNVSDAVNLALCGDESRHQEVLDSCVNHIDAARKLYLAVTMSKELLELENRILDRLTEPRAPHDIARELALFRSAIVVEAWRVASNLAALHIANEPDDTPKSDREIGLSDSSKYTEIVQSCTGTQSSLKEARESAALGKEKLDHTIDGGEQGMRAEYTSTTIGHSYRSDFKEDISEEDGKSILCHHSQSLSSAAERDSAQELPSLAEKTQERERRKSLGGRTKSNGNLSSREEAEAGEKPKERERRKSNTDFKIDGISSPREGAEAAEKPKERERRKSTTAKEALNGIHSLREGAEAAEKPDERGRRKSKLAKEGVDSGGGFSFPKETDAAEKKRKFQDGRLKASPTKEIDSEKPKERERRKSAEKVPAIGSADVAGGHDSHRRRSKTRLFSSDSAASASGSADVAGTHDSHRRRSKNRLFTSDSVASVESSENGDRTTEGSQHKSHAKSGMFASSSSAGDVDISERLTFSSVLEASEGDNSEECDDESDRNDARSLNLKSFANFVSRKANERQHEHMPKNDFLVKKTISNRNVMIPRTRADCASGRPTQ